LSGLFFFCHVFVTCIFDCLQKTTLLWDMQFLNV
jgi:hypothetical protein